MLGECSEICTFVSELDTVSLVIYCTQLCLIYTKSISDKTTTSPMTQQENATFALTIMTTPIWMASFLLSAAGYYSFAL